MVEPTACAVHAAAAVDKTEMVAVIGAGTLGLLTIAALRATSGIGTILATAKHPEQRRLARELGADQVVEPGELARTVRSATGSFMVDGQLTDGVATVVDCVGSEASLVQALQVVAPGGDVIVVGMPGRVSLDLTSLWHRETGLRGCYAYTRADFDRAMTLVADADLGRLVSATYLLDRYTDAVEHAATAGARGAVKIAFDLRGEKRR
jgi:threonine dehydrogenase-like Zn-dependent dehydrogenase